MGREIKRVPLDFNAPLGKEWAGNHNPHYKPCPEDNKTCFGGYTGAGKWLDAICRLIALVGEEALAEPHAAELKARGRIFPHPYLESLPERLRHLHGLRGLWNRSGREGCVRRLGA